MIPSTEAAVFFAQFAGRHTFQTFDDRPNKDARLSRVLHDPAELAALNRQGAGVFLMVNEGDGAGRKNSNVTRVRAYFADFDGQPLPARWPLEPSMLVESSPSKFHAYWIFEDSQTLPLDGSAFNAQQEAIAHAVGSCPDDCKGLSRVMRLPGFLHQKGEPFMTRILSSTGQRYSLSQIQTAFPLPVVQVSPPNPSLCRTQGERAASLSAVRRKYALSTLHSLADELSQAVEGERNKNLNAAAYRLGQLIGGGHLDLERAQSVLWRAAAAVGLPNSEIQRVLPRALTDGQAEPDLLENVGQNGQKDTDGGEKKERFSASSRVMDYAREDGAELWHDQSGAAYLTATVKGHREHYRLPSTSARDYLQALFYNREQRPLSLQAQGEAVAVMQALARREGEEHRTAVRLIHLEGFTYLDLGTPTWEAVEIGLGYWKVIGPHDCPVRFTRPAGLLPLPTPEHGGSLTELREYLNTDDKGFLMCLAWALGALSGVSPFPVLALSGEQGTGKSTAATVLQNLIDPHEADRRRAPKEERDLFIAAQAAHVLCYDNLSSIQGWLSDGLCVLSTGGAFTTRTLYSDGDETILKAVRPVIINGIPDLLARPDLAERALTVTLYRIPSEKRVSEKVFWSRYERGRSRLLGSLLTALAEGFLHLDGTELEHAPRLADFARLIVAAEGALPWEKGAFLAAYGQMQSEAAGTVLDGEPVAEALRALMDDGQEWLGTVKALLATLNDQEGYPDEHRPPQGWPRTPRALGGSLRRLAPALSKTGYVVTPEGRSREGERYRLIKEMNSTCTTYTTLTEPRQDDEKPGVLREGPSTPPAPNVHTAGAGVNIGEPGVNVELDKVHPKNAVSDGAGVGDVDHARSVPVFRDKAELAGSSLRPALTLDDLTGVEEGDDLPGVVSL